MVHENDLLHFLNDKWLVEMNYMQVINS